MVTTVYCSEDFIMYIIANSLCHPPANIILFINYTLTKNKGKKTLLKLKKSSGVKVRHVRTKLFKGSGRENMRSSRKSRVKFKI